MSTVTLEALSAHLASVREMKWRAGSCYRTCLEGVWESRPSVAEAAVSRGHLDAIMFCNQCLQLPLSSETKAWLKQHLGGAPEFSSCHAHRAFLPQTHMQQGQTGPLTFSILRLSCSAADVFYAPGAEY